MFARGSLVLGVVLVTQAALAQGSGAPPPRGMPPPGMMQNVTLSTSDVERLLRLLPIISKESARYAAGQMAGPTPAPTSKAQQEEMKKLEAVLSKEGLSLVDFAMQMSALVATYLALDPAAFDAQLPSESTPEIARILADPKVPQEQKDGIRMQIKMANENKELIRAQVLAAATEPNKKVVKPLLPKVKAALDAARAEARKHAMPPPR